MKAAPGEEIESHWGDIPWQEGQGENEDKSEIIF